MRMRSCRPFCPGWQGGGADGIDPKLNAICGGAMSDSCDSINLFSRDFPDSFFKRKSQEVSYHRHKLLSPTRTGLFH
jgi:hypothetical protein